MDNLNKVWEHNERMKGEDSNLPLADHNVLLKRRKEELRHAQDIKELYERKLEKVNDLYLELNAMKIQLEERERTLCKRERQLNNGSKVHYKKKKQLKPFVTAVTGRGAGGRRSLSMTAAGARYVRQRRKLRQFCMNNSFMKVSARRCRKSSPSTPEVLSTSPETPSKPDPNFGRPRFVAADHVTKIVGSSAAATTTTVRENPMWLLPAEGGTSTTKSGSVGLHNYSPPLDHPPGAAGVDWARLMVEPEQPRQPRQHRVEVMHPSNQNLARRQGGLTGQPGAVRGCKKSSSSVPS